MIDFLLDTDIASTSSRDNRRKLWPDYKPWVSRKSESSTIALSELEYGVSKSSKPEQNKLALAEFVAPLEIIAYGDAAAAHYGRIRTLLERQGTPIGRLDTLIAAHASALGCTLVTNNDREFSRIPNLVVENWIS